VFDPWYQLGLADERKTIFPPLKRRGPTFSSPDCRRVDEKLQECTSAAEAAEVSGSSRRPEGLLHPANRNSLGDRNSPEGQLTLSLLGSFLVEPGLKPRDLFRLNAALKGRSSTGSYEDTEGLLHSASGNREYRALPI
jgi:hypothetical protein